MMIIYDIYDPLLDSLVIISPWKNTKRFLVSTNEAICVALMFLELLVAPCRARVASTGLASSP